MRKLKTLCKVQFLLLYLGVVLLIYAVFSVGIYSVVPSSIVDISGALEMRAPLSHNSITFDDRKLSLLLPILINSIRYNGTPLHNISLDYDLKQLIRTEVKEQIHSIPDPVEVSKRKECTPVQHIFYLKMHKCGSSTLQNIFLRYGFTHNLTFALPLKQNLIGYPGLFVLEQLPSFLLPPGGKVDMFVLHTRLNELEHRKVIYPDAKWITILREPVSMYESFFTYFGFENAFGVRIEDYGNYDAETLILKTRGQSRAHVNEFLFDLGISETLPMQYIGGVIAYMEKLFDLIVITELFDESLILLKDLLCWDVQNMLSVPKLRRIADRRHSLPKKAVQVIKEMNQQNIVIYSYFLTRHEEKVNEYGREKMERELHELREIQTAFHNKCMKMKINPPTWKNVDCFFYFKNELLLVDLIRNKTIVALQRPGRFQYTL